MPILSGFNVLVNAECDRADETGYFILKTRWSGSWSGSWSGKSVFLKRYSNPITHPKTAKSA